MTSGGLQLLESLPPGWWLNLCSGVGKGEFYFSALSGQCTASGSFLHLGGQRQTECEFPVWDYPKVPEVSPPSCALGLLRIFLKSTPLPWPKGTQGRLRHSPEAAAGPGLGACSDLWICPRCSWAPAHCPARALHPAPHPRGLVHPVVLLEMENGAYVSKGTRVGILPGHLRELHPAHELRRYSRGATRANGAFGIDLILWNLKLRAVPFSLRKFSRALGDGCPPSWSGPSSWARPRGVLIFFFNPHLINVRFLSGSTDYLKRTISPRSNFIRIYSHLCSVSLGK